MSSLAQEFAYMEAHIHQDKGPMIKGVSLTFTILATVFVSARIFVRVDRSAGLWWDDYFILAALATVIGMCAMMWLLVEAGFGKHVLLLTEAKAINFVKYNFAWSWIYPASMSFTKMSITFLYRRVFPPKNFRWLSIFTIVIGVYIILWTIGTYVAICVICLPLPHDWLTETCRPPVSLSYSTSILNIVSDVAILIAPQPIIWSLRKPLKDRIRLGCLFLLGSSACIISIVRTPLLAPVKTEIDYTYILVTPALLSLLEPEIGIICACAPMMLAFTVRARDSVSSGFSLARRGISQRTTSVHSDEMSIRREPKSEMNFSRNSASTISDATSWPENEMSEKDAETKDESPNNRTSDQSIMVTRGYSIKRVTRSPKPPVSRGWTFSPRIFGDNNNQHPSPV